jgi:hypothetical protein
MLKTTHVCLFRSVPSRSMAFRCFLCRLNFYLNNETFFRVYDDPKGVGVRFLVPTPGSSRHSIMALPLGLRMKYPASVSMVLIPIPNHQPQTRWAVWTPVLRLCSGCHYLRSRRWSSVETRTRTRKARWGWGGGDSLRQMGYLTETYLRR